MAEVADVATLWPLSSFSTPESGPESGEPSRTDRFAPDQPSADLIGPDYTESDDFTTERARTAHVEGMHESNIPQLLTPAQVSEALQISPRTLDDWRMRGYGPRYAVLGKHARYPVEELERFIAQQLKGVA